MLPDANAQRLLYPAPVGATIITIVYRQLAPGAIVEFPRPRTKNSILVERVAYNIHVLSARPARTTARPGGALKDSKIDHGQRTMRSFAYVYY
jgi:hypothetical protein